MISILVTTMLSVAPGLDNHQTQASLVSSSPEEKKSKHLNVDYVSRSIDRTEDLWGGPVTVTGPNSKHYRDSGDLGEVKLLTLREA